MGRPIAGNLLRRERQFVAPALGAACLLGALVGLGLGPTPSIAIGGLAWLGAWALLAPRRLSPAEASAATAAETLAQDLGPVRQRVTRLRQAASTIRHAGTRNALAAVAGHVDALLEELARDPGEYRQVRAALQEQLEHVVVVAERLAQLQRAGKEGERLIAAAEPRLTAVAELFSRYRGQGFASEALDLDVHLTLLDHAVRAEGLPVPPPIGKPAA